MATATMNGSVIPPSVDSAGLTVAEAATRLGLSKVAVRHKIRRGSLPAFKDEEGEWRVPPEACAAAQEAVLAAAYTPAQAAAPTTDYAAAQTVVRDEGDTQKTTAGELLTAALAAAQASEVRRLEETLALVREELEVRRREQETEREAHRREVEQLHTLLAQAHQLALPAPRPDPEPSSPQKEQDAAPAWPERRSWWQRLVWG